MRWHQGLTMRTCWIVDHEHVQWTIWSLPTAPGNMYFLGLEEALSDWCLFFFSCEGETDVHRGQQIYQTQSHKSLDGGNDGSDEDQDEDGGDEIDDCEAIASLKRRLSVPQLRTEGAKHK
jgi:hypothetical protein